MASEGEGKPLDSAASSAKVINDAQEALRESQIARKLLEAVLNADAIAEPEAEVNAAERPGEQPEAESAAAVPDLPSPVAAPQAPPSADPPKVRQSRECDIFFSAACHKKRAQIAVNGS